MPRFTENKPTIISLWSAALLLSLCCVAPPAHAANFITVNSTADNLTGGNGSCTLREAINNANNDGVDQTGGDCVIGAGADTVVVPAGTYTIAITAAGDDANLSGDFDSTDPVGITIQGAGADKTIIDGGGFDRVFHAVLGNITISGVTIRNGSASTNVLDTNEFGGGVRGAAAVDISNSTISGNTVTSGPAGVSAPYGYGGGVYAGGALTVGNSTISGNTATGGVGSPGGQGGGVYHAAAATITNSTISGNTAFGSAGGGLYGIGALTMSNSTVSGNSSNVGGGLYLTVGGNSITSSTIAGTSTGFASAGAVTIDHTILSNTGSNCAGAGAVTSGGYNISSDASCTTLTATGDLQSTDPMLGALANNGGGTFTRKLLTGSPAIDIYTSATCAVATDQRGVPRPQGSGCDSGAFELSPADTIIAAIGAGKGGCVIGPVERFGPALPVILLLLAGIWWIRRRSE